MYFIIADLPEQDLAPALPPADDIPLRDQFLKRRPDCAPNPGISVPYSSAPPENDRPNHWVSFLKDELLIIEFDDYISNHLYSSKGGLKEVNRMRKIIRCMIVV